MITLVVEIVATLAVALWLGGTLALGAFAAPVVFGELQGDTAGTVMGTIFARFDRMVVVLAMVLVATEVVRVALGGVRGKLGLARSLAAVLLVVLALVSALWLGPRINELFELGVRRGVGPQGADMDRLHDWATTLAKVAFAIAVAWLTLGVIENRRSRPGAAMNRRS